MTVSTRNRRSKFLLDFSPLRDGLSVNGAPLAVSSGKLITGTFDRGGTPNTAYAMDAFGYFAAPGYKQPRFTHRYNSATALIEPAGMLLEGSIATHASALGSCLLGDTTYFSNAAAYALASAVSCIRGQTATKHTGTGASDPNRYRTIGTFVSGQTDCLSAIFEQGNATTCGIKFYDSIAAADAASVTLTWATMGVAGSGPAIGSYGVETLAAVGPNGGKLARIWLTCTGAASGTAGDGNSRITGIAPINSTSSNYAYFHHYNVEPNAKGPSAPVVNAASALTRSADSLYFDFNYPPSAGALTMYAKIVLSAANSGGVCKLGTSGGSTPHFSLYAPSATQYALLHHNGTSQVSTTRTVGGSRNDLVELCAKLAADGSITLDFSLNGAAVSGGTASAANAINTAGWAAARLYLNIVNSVNGASAFQGIRVAAGVQSLGYMRAG